jgi:hypothetical protein
LKNKDKHLALAEITSDIILFWAEAHISGDLLQRAEARC